jgi:hypothetical protein
MRLMLILSAVLAASPVQAKPKKPKASDSVKKAKERPPTPRPDDKSQNEGAQGRRNATEDAAQAAEPPTYYGGRRP